VKTSMVKLQYARKTKIVQFPEGTEKCHVNVETKFEKNMIEVTEDTQIMDVTSIMSEIPTFVFILVKVSKLFNLKIDSMGECLTYHQEKTNLNGMDGYIKETVCDLKRLHRAYDDVSGINEASYSVFIRAVLVGVLQTYNPQQLISITEAKKESITQGFAQNLVQLHSSYMTNQRKTDNEETSKLQVLFGIVSTGTFTT
ncbi:4434_t:CDS:2, partial [Entrophospora sp. SA101]